VVRTGWTRTEEIAPESEPTISGNEKKEIIWHYISIQAMQYPAKVAQYADHLLLVGISYHRETKTHTCCIEQYAV